MGKRTALYEAHSALGAKIVDFSGWEMPLQYKGVIQEHLNVRSHVGIFDVSHMGRILVEGPDAEKLLNKLSTNDLFGKKVGSATYTVWCHESGTCVDDLIIYKEASDRFFLIVNAGNRDKDLAHLLQYATSYNVKVTDRYQEDGILAIQGPNAESLVSRLFPQVKDLKHMHFINASYADEPIVIAATGYTGAGGYEVYASNTTIAALWDKFLLEGKPFGIEPIGLAARDTLRLEMGYALYGHEISDSISPTESVSAWTVKWSKPSFLGKEALQKLENSPTKRHEYGIILIDKGIAREGYPVFQNDKQIGVVTSGTQSPSLNQAIAIVLVERNLQDGDSVEVQIRQNKCRAKVVKLPFYRR